MRNISTSPRLTVLDFFAGVGLSRMALERAGWRVIWANDSSAMKLATYRANFPDDGATILCGDIHDLRADELPRAAVASASFPCTDLSLAGRGAGLAGAASGAVYAFLTLIRALGERRPQAILLENVPGWLTRREGADLLIVAEALAALGYSLDLLLVDAARFVAQSRPRVFLIAVQASAGPLPHPLQRDTRPAGVAAFIHAHPALPWRLSDPAPLPMVPAVTLVEALDRDAAWWSAERTEALLAQMSALQRQTLAPLVAAPTITIGAAYRRTRPTGVRIEARWDGLAGCLRTAGGGSSRQIILAAGGGRLRARSLTPREGARLMGAPDFILPAGATEAFNALGDGVAVPAVTWIAAQILTPAAQALIAEGRPDALAAPAQARRCEGHEGREESSPRAASDAADEALCPLGRFPTPPSSQGSRGTPRHANER